MHILNIEIKAKTYKPEEIESILLDHGAKFIGEDHQLDTYFNVPSGRLKIREGTIEKSLIYYHRVETKDLKKSKVLLQKLPDEYQVLKAILETLHGVWKVVDKKRKIFFIDHIKFHIDQVDGLGSFVEIEAIDKSGEIGEARLRNQCQEYVDILGIEPKSFIDQSYSDMI